MKKGMFVFTAACVFAVTCGAATSASNNVIRLKHDPLLMKTGGMLSRPGAKPGKLLIFNAQQNVNKTDFGEALNYITKKVCVRTEVVEGSVNCDAASLKTAAAKSGGNMTIFLIDQDSAAALGIFPEDNYAVVNVGALKKDGATSPYVNARTRKEIIRAFLYLCGGASSKSVMNLMGVINSTKDLDKYEDDVVPLDVLARTAAYLQQTGFELDRPVPYRLACREGWAPAPTNDIQKAIWNQVHALPSNPIKIKYDPKRDK